MTAPFPSLLRCGPYTYQVRLVDVDDPAWSDLGVDPDCHYGYTDHGRQLVLVNADTSETTRRVILLHEALHAAAFAAGQFHDRPRREEAWVSSVSPLLLDALRESPELVAYLTGSPS